MEKTQLRKAAKQYRSDDETSEDEYTNYRHEASSSNGPEIEMHKTLNATVARMVAEEDKAHPTVWRQVRF
jgi:hypothetical protein